MALLHVENVRRRFGGLVALDKVAFDVHAGQIKAIIGPNGAGKTTLFNVISGLIRPDAGKVVFEDRDVTGFAPHQVARLGIARTFQNPSLFPRMNVLENVMVGRHCRSRSGFAACALRWWGQGREEAGIRSTAMEWLDYVGLARLAELPSSALAFGQRRMVELARALALEPRLLLLDEPASGLNTKEKLDLGELIRRIRDRGITVLLVEHDMTMVMDLSDEIFALHNGVPLMEGPPDVVRNDPRVISVYLGEELSHDAASA